MTKAERAEMQKRDAAIAAYREALSNLGAFVAQLNVDSYLSESVALLQAPDPGADLLKRHAEELVEEKERADSNFQSCERIKGKYSDCHNELAAAKKELHETHSLNLILAQEKHAMNQERGRLLVELVAANKRAEERDAMVGTALDENLRLTNTNTLLDTFLKSATKRAEEAEAPREAQIETRVQIRADGLLMENRKLQTALAEAEQRVQKAEAAIRVNDERDSCELREVREALAEAKRDTARLDVAEKNCSGYIRGTDYPQWRIDGTVEGGSQTLRQAIDAMSEAQPNKPLAAPVAKGPGQEGAL